MLFGSSSAGHTYISVLPNYILFSPTVFRKKMDFCFYLLRQAYATNICVYACRVEFYAQIFLPYQSSLIFIVMIPNQGNGPCLQCIGGHHSFQATLS
jgi:hypothetical protein